MGGGSKQLTSLYINNSGSSKVLNNAYGNINGSNKEIFSATKYYWWRAYPVTRYKLKKNYYFYNSDLGLSNVLKDNINIDSYPNRYTYKYCDITNDGYLKLTSGSKSLTTSTDSYGTTYSYPSGNYLCNTSFVFSGAPDYIGDITSSSTFYIRDYIYHIKDGYCYYSSDHSEEYVRIEYDYWYFAIPVEHSTSYSMVRCLPANNNSSNISAVQKYPPAIRPMHSLNNNNVYKYQTDGGDYLFTFTEVSTTTECEASRTQVTDSTKGGYGCKWDYGKAYYTCCNGYWWVYDGYHT